MSNVTMLKAERY